MSGLRVFLDETPGEARGVVMRDDRFERLLIQRDDAVAAHRLSARSIGRVTEIHAALGGAFVDLGVGPPFGFLSLGRARLTQGEVVEVEVTAEPRERKGPVLALRGVGAGPPRLLAPGPDVRAILSDLAPEAEVVTGLAAIEAGLQAEEEALAADHGFAETGLDLAVQRTRALVAVDIDHAPQAGRDPKAGRARANRQGLTQAARLIRLKSWGGLVVIDLVGAGLDGKAVSAQAAQAFAGDAPVIGPLSRFGLLQLALPWRRTPIEEQLLDAGGRRTLASRAVDVARRLNQATLSDTAAPRIVAVCAPDVAAAAAPLVARLGPRAAVRPDPAMAASHIDIMEG